MLKIEIIFKHITRYSIVGIINTVLHISIFYIMVSYSISSTIANFTAFFLVSIFSFIINAKWTFKKSSNFSRYILFVSLMGVSALGTGWLADYFILPPTFSLVLFALLSWIVGYLCSYFIIFK